MKAEINDKAHELGLKYFPNEQNIWARENIEAIYCSGACIDMAEWMQKKMIDKACEWLCMNMTSVEYFGINGNISKPAFIRQFKKAMKGE